MNIIYRSETFSLSQAAVDHMAFLRDQYLRQFPEDPPVLAGIFAGHLLTGSRAGAKQLGIGFWRRSEVSDQVWQDEDIVDIAGFKVLFTIPKIDALMFRDGVIDYTPQDALVLRAANANEAASAEVLD